MQLWWARIAAMVTGVGLALAVPALAWAAERPVSIAVADELARRRPRGVGFLGGLGTLCCLAVVVIIVLVVILMMRRKQR